MKYVYRPEGVCSNEIVFEIEKGIVEDIRINGGCAGNTIGISQLLKGMKIEDIIRKLKGTPCGFRGTSCPDQIAKALEKFKKDN